MIYECIVIGAGPAGMAAAIQMKRAGLAVALIEKDEVGGLLRNANRIENYLGFSEAPSGKKLIERFRKHLRSLGITPIRETVKSIEKKGGVFTVRSEMRAFRSRNVIVATGTVPKEAGIRGERALRGKNVFYEIWELPEARRSRVIAVIGGGDAGFDYALQLSRQGHDPVIIARGKAKCLPILKKRAQQQKIRCIEHCSPKRIRRSGRRVEVLCSGNRFVADHVLIAVGRKPQRPQIVTKSRHGLYFVGDVSNAQHRQVHIATGDALRTAMNVIRSTHS